MATSYSNQGATGFRHGEIEYTMSVSASSIGGFKDSVIDGVLTGTSSSTAFFLNTATRDVTITFIWGADTSVIIDAFKWYQSGDQTHSTYVFEGSNDLSGWTQIGSSFTLGGTRTSGYIEYTFTNSTGYRAYRIRQSAATDNNVTPWCQGVEFKIEEATSGGISNRASAFNPTGGLPSGSGTRTGSITVTSTATDLSGVPSHLVNDDLAQNSTGSWSWNAGSSKEVKFAWGAGVKKWINGICWRQSTVNDSGTWKLAGSNDDSGYTDLVTGITLNAFYCYKYWTKSATSYRYYKLIQTAGTTSTTPWLMEVYFRVQDDSPGGGASVQPVLITAISG